MADVALDGPVRVFARKTIRKPVADTKRLSFGWPDTREQSARCENRSTCDTMCGIRGRKRNSIVGKGLFYVAKAADLLWEMLADTGVKRFYGIVGEALNPVINGLRRNGRIEFIYVRREE